MRFLSLLLVMLVALVMAPKLARAAYQPPPIAGHVTDTAGKLSPEEVSALNTKLADYRKCSGNHVAVFFTRSLEGQTIEDVAYGTFNTWKIGQGGKDNGVLLVLAPNERRIRIETGKGVGGDLTDIESSHIIRDQIAPSMKAERFFEAADNGTAAIGRALGGCAMGAAVVAAPPEGARRKAPPSPPVERATPNEYFEQRLAMAAGIGVLAFLAALGSGARFTSLFVGGIGAFCSFIASSFFGRKALGGGVDLDALTGVFGVLGLLFVIVNIPIWIARVKRGVWTIFDPPAPGTSSSGSSSSSSSFGSSSSTFGSSSSIDTSSWSSSSSSSSDYSGGGGSSGGGGASDSY